MAFVKGSVDKNAKENGVWKEFDGGEFLIAHISNTRFVKLITDKEEYESDFERNKAYANALVLDWHNVEDLDGEPVPYSSEAVAEEMGENDEFAAFILSTAQDMQAYKRKQDKEKIEKVKKRSSGN